MLEACKGKGFAGLRDDALIRLYATTGVRLCVVGNLLVAAVGLDTESVHVHGKGARDRRGAVRVFGPKTAWALSRYLRARDKRKGAGLLPNLCLADRGTAPLTPNSIKIRLKGARSGRRSAGRAWAPRGGTASRTGGSGPGDTGT